MRKCTISGCLDLATKGDVCRVHYAEVTGKTTEATLDSERDRESWRVYAAASLTGIISTMDSHMGVITRDTITNAAKVADLMLAEELKRRDV